MKKGHIERGAIEPDLEPVEKPFNPCEKHLGQCMSVRLEERGGLRMKLALYSLHLTDDEASALLKWLKEHYE